MILSPPQTVILSPERSEIADFIGERRQRAVERMGAHDARGAQIDREEAVALHVFGARGESAARLFFRDEPAWNRNNADLDPNCADLGDFIDVKAVRRADHALIVSPHNLHADWAYFLVDGSEHPKWRMVGWLYGQEINAGGFLSKPDYHRPVAYTVPQAALWRKPMALYDVWKEREEAK